MDHIGFLTLMRKLQYGVRDAVAESQKKKLTWTPVPGTMVMPETLCPWCRKALRSNAIWIFSNPPRYSVFEGIVPLRNGKFRLEYPGMPNLMGCGGRGGLCLGSYETGMALLSGPANLHDCPMGIHNLPAWYRKYWDHPLCKEGYQYFAKLDRDCGTEYIHRLHSETTHLTDTEREVREE